MKAARYTIERQDEPLTRCRRNGRENSLPIRFLGQGNDGRLYWMERFGPSNHFPTRRAAVDFITHRLRGTDPSATVVRHTVH